MKLTDLNRNELEARLLKIGTHAWNFEIATAYHTAPLGSDIPRLRNGVAALDASCPTCIHEIYRQIKDTRRDEHLRKFEIPYLTYMFLYGE